LGGIERKFHLGRRSKMVEVEKLTQQIADAWREVESDPQHRLRPVTRLKIYDLLVSDLETPLSVLVKTEHRFPQKTAGLKRYYYLGLLTLEKVLPIWQNGVGLYIDELMGGAPDPQVWRDFPYLIQRCTLELLKGRSAEDFPAQVQEEWGSDPGPTWHINIGNCYDSMLWQHVSILETAYTLYHAVHLLLLPIRLWNTVLVLDEIYDDELSPPECRDFAYYAAEAYASDDPNPPGWVRSYEERVTRDPTKLLAFWQWWLQEAVPQAASVDITRLDWA
jgi:hypothetical protein